MYMSQTGTLIYGNSHFENVTENSAILYTMYRVPIHPKYALIYLSHMSEVDMSQDLKYVLWILHFWICFHTNWHCESVSCIYLAAFSVSFLQYVLPACFVFWHYILKVKLSSFISLLFIYLYLDCGQHDKWQLWQIWWKRPQWYFTHRVSGTLHYLTSEGTTMNLKNYVDLLKWIFWNVYPTNLCRVPSYWEWKTIYFQFFFFFFISF